LKSVRAKTYSRPLASKSGLAFALPTLQLVPPLPTGPVKHRLWQICPGESQSAGCLVDLTRRFALKFYSWSPFVILLSRNTLDFNFPASITTLKWRSLNFVSAVQWLDNR